MTILKNVSLFLLLLFLSSIDLNAQQNGRIQGEVVDESQKPVEYANVGIKNSENGTTTNEEGRFTIKNVPAGQQTLKLSSVGFQEKEIKVNLKAGETNALAITMQESSQELNEVVVTGTMNEMRLKDSPVKVQIAGENFLDNDPNSSMIDAVQNMNGVQQQIDCGVCGTNSIRINGMEGPYTLVLIDGMPIMSNLGSVYGLNGIPTSLVDQIEVVKGPNSTLYGTEAMGGVINVRTKSPEDMPLLSLNTYYTSHRELNADVSFSPTISDKVKTTFSGNVFHNNKKYDFNDDNFMDVVLHERYSLFNKWTFERKNNRAAHIAGRYYKEKRNGGVMEFEPEMRSSDSIYGESIHTERFEIIGAYDIPFGSELIHADFSFNHHDQDSYYGTEDFLATQMTWFTNITWRKQLGNHQLLTGATGRWEKYEDNSPADSDVNQPIPGIFAQDQWDVTTDFTALGGLRVDYQQDHGAIVSPRLNLKYNTGRWTTLRLNFGTGFRQVHLFTEDHAALTGTREVVVREDLDPEQSYNLSLNLNHIYQIDHFGSGSFDIDLFYTVFSNKITPNFNISQDSIIYQNLDGFGVTRGASFSMNHNFSFPFSAQFGITVQEAFEKRNNEVGERVKREIEFTPVVSGNFSLRYQWKKPGLSFNYTGRIVGPQDLPEFDEPFDRDERSSWYTVQNLKVAKSVTHSLSIYAGVKNLWDWTQPSPLIDPEHPFGGNFDTNYAYGPIQPRRFYVGLKWHLNRKHNK